VTRRDLIEEVARHYPRFSRREAEVMVNTVFAGPGPRGADRDSGLWQL